MTPLRARLRSRLTDAMRERDRALASTLRGVLSALENAEAVPGGAGRTVATSEHVAGGAVGVASAEAPRRTLTVAEEREVVELERAELNAAAVTYDEAGAADRADELRRSAAVVTAILEEELC
jgi:uncharacterized protein